MGEVGNSQSAAITVLAEAHVYFFCFVCLFVLGGKKCGNACFLLDIDVQ